MLIGPHLPRLGAALPARERKRQRRIRLNKLIEMLRMHCFVRGPDLAHALNVSITTVQKDLRELLKAGHRIDSSSGYGYMYRGSKSVEVSTYVPAAPARALRSSQAVETYRRRRLIADAVSESPLTTAQDLAERFQKTERTIYRDIDALKSMGFPIIGASGHGYSMKQQKDFGGMQL